MSFCFTRFHGNIYAILNWRMRENKGKTGLILRKLSPQEAQSYEQARSKGTTDSGIFQSLFPPQSTSTGANTNTWNPNQDVEFLGRERLVELINAKLGATLKTLWHMSREDLTQLLEHLDRLETLAHSRNI